MTREEAEEYAKEMTYRDAIFNLAQAKSIPYRKATFIKIYELLDMHNCTVDGHDGNIKRMLSFGRK